jgi:hypothetical protein
MLKGSLVLFLSCTQSLTQIYEREGIAVPASPQIASVNGTNAPQSIPLILLSAPDGARAPVLPWVCMVSSLRVM